MIADNFRVVSEDAAVPVAIALGAARAIGITIIFPLFTLFNISGILRFGLAIGLSAPWVYQAYQTLLGTPTTWLDVGVLGLKEVVFGALLGIAFGLPFWSAQAAGDMADVYRGANAANLFDQVNSLETTTLGSILMTVALGIFVTAGGLVDLTAIFYNSFTLWPVFKIVPVAHTDWLSIILTSFSHLFRAAALLASPFVIVLCVIELSLAFVSRSSQQLPLNDGISTFKNLATLVVLVVYAMFIGSYFSDLWIAAFNGVKTILELHPGEK